VVEDHEQFARLITHQLGGRWDVVIANDRKTALATLSNVALAAAIVDVNLPDGSGLEVVREIRKFGETTPILVLTGVLDQNRANQINLWNAGYVVKHTGWENNVRKFASAITPTREQALRAETLGVARRHGFSSRETETLLLHVLGLSRSAIAERLSISPWTVHTHLSGAVHRAGHDRLADLRAAIVDAVD
jgi:DNA-binding NarL/FixJ family response regulator